jgi:hypothetical protein
MTERTVTEQQVVDVFNIAVPLDQRIFLNLIFSELFPELPAHNELVKVWNNDELLENNNQWYLFQKLNSDGSVHVRYPTTTDRYDFDNYRRQTPAERGEG